MQINQTYKSNIILGINTFHADASACIIVNGRLVAAIEEERVNRIKHYAGYPIKAIQKCLKLAQIESTDITDIAFNTKPKSNLIQKGFFFLKNLNFKNNNYISRFKKKINIHQQLLQNFNFRKEIKIHFIEHHLAHIASAYYPSKLNDAIGLSIDGSGDFVSIAISECKNNKISIKNKIFFPNSLGIFYHSMTQFLGFNNYGDEYKIMGMAAYGKPIYSDKIKENLFKYNEKKFKLNLKYFNHQKPDFKYLADNTLEIDQIFNSNLRNLFKDEINKDKQFKENFASSVQDVYEFFFKKIIHIVNKKKFSKNLVFSGGCALNSSANKFLTNNKAFDKVFINNAPGDNGGALGAAFLVSSRYNNNKDNFENPYIGPSFDNFYTLKILKNYHSKKMISFKEYDLDEILKITVNKISEANVIGWFQGNMEFGPRALGNRSILADPRNPNMKNIINSKIKRRESFRPFAPSILQEFQSEWFQDTYFNPYMSSLSNVRRDKIKLIPAVTHVDGTARIQTVNENTNNIFYKLIKEFYKKTKVPILLNTSFNENEPIVMLPEQAIDCLLRTDMDMLVINNFIIKKF